MSDSLINSFVAMFDFIGYKRLRESRGTAGLFQLYERGLLPSIEHSAAGEAEIVVRAGRRVFVPKQGALSVRFQVVSDTVVLFADADDFDAYIRIVTASERLLSFGFAGHQAPLRGAIGHGDLMLNSRGVWLGSAIEDAYAGEACQVWSGCALTPQCEEFATKHGYIDRMKEIFRSAAADEKDSGSRNKLTGELRLLTQYDIPLYHNPKDAPASYFTRRGWVLDWTSSTYKGASEKSFMPTTDAHAQKIAANTRTFEDWARQHNC